MPRQRDPKRDEAFEIFKKHNGNIQNREIARILDVPEKTVSGWKSKDKWNEKLNGVLQTKIRSTPNKKVTKKARSPNKKEEKPIVESDELTEKQRLFCIYYVKSFNATQAAIKAGYAPESAHVEGSRLLRNAKVSAEIKRIKQEMTSGLFIEAMDVLQKYIKIAFADITDYVTFGQKEVPVIGMFGPIEDDEGNPVTQMVNYVEFKDSNMVDGTIISEVKQGKDGISIKLADKMKALDKLAQYFDLFPDQFKRKIEEEKLKLAKQQKQQVEVETPIFVDDVDEED
ncbi:terminase [Bacillus methanolicus]|uniref:terminase small subunit n=1 Tax=Bacillus methanolicus TaxID=1471 RepID=UPI0023808C28|nr:terminase small subunit [Bacillus methanolicus]MDE3837923.1 terminase [Bacillus methanolicus]